MISNETLLLQIADSKKQLNESLQQLTPDPVYILGILNFARSKLLTLILSDINRSINETSPDDEQNLAQQANTTDQSAEALIDQAWNDFYHPVFKFHQSQIQSLKAEEGKHRKRTVEIRKAFDKFRKIANSTSSFYNDLAKQILTHYKLSFIIPNHIYETLEFTEDKNANPINKNGKEVIKLVYGVHRCLLYLGSTSRYICILSGNNTTAGEKASFEALRLCHCAELLLPAFGDPRNQLGLLYDSFDDKLVACHEFLRSSLSRIPSKIGSTNYKSLSNNTVLFREQLNKALLYNQLEGDNPYRILTAFFISLHGYYTSPTVWKNPDGRLINGSKVEKIENEFFRVVDYAAKAGSYNHILEKILTILIGAIHIENKAKSSSNSTPVSPLLTNLLKFTFKYVNYIQVLFIELWDENKERSQALLPFLRIVYCWLKVNRLPLQYSNRNIEFLKGTALISNLIYKAHPEETFNKRPIREQFFEEDVGLREFMPLGRLLSDFDDTIIFQDKNSPSKLIGHFGPHDLRAETRLRFIAVGSITKKLLKDNTVGITFSEESNSFDVSKAQVFKKKTIDIKTNVLKKDLPPSSSPLLATSKNQAASKKSNTKVKGASKHKQTSKRLQKNQEPIIIKSSSPISEPSDVVVTSDNHDQSEYDPKNLKDTDKVIQSNSTIFAEDLEANLIQKEKRYENMVDSLVDHSFTASTDPAVENVENASISKHSSENIWQTHISSSIPSQHALSPFINQNSMFAQYQPYNGNHVKYQTFQNQNFTPMPQYQNLYHPQQQLSPNPLLQPNFHQPAYEMQHPITQVLRPPTFVGTNPAQLHAHNHQTTEPRSIQENTQNNYYQYR